MEINEMTQQELGIFGESLAQRHLRKNGYKIRTTNYRFLKYEIDIVAEKNGALVIVEVKTRQTAEIGEPWRAVTRQKQKQIVATADHYVQSRDLPHEVRFDIISIVHNSFRTDIEHIEDAFTA
jgi:putative endonuclease